MNTSFSKKDTAAVKGIAILLLLMYHCFLNESRFEGFTISFYPFSQEFIINITKTAKCCVGIFTFLSVYGMSISFINRSKSLDFSPKEAENLTLKRLIHLLSGFLVAYLFCFLGCCIFSPSPLKVYRGYKTFIPYMLFDMLGLAQLLNTPSLVGDTWWYMGFAITLIIFFPVFLKAYKNLGLFLAPAILSILCCFNLEVNDYNRWLLLVPVGIAFAYHNLFEKVKGWHAHKNRIVDFLIRFIIMTVLLFMAVYYSRWNHGKRNFMTPLFDTFLTVTIIVWAYLFFIRIPMIKEILMFLGKHSMNIFLVHTFIRVKWFYEYTYSFGHFALVVIMLLLESLLISIFLEAFKKYSGYNTLVKKMEGIVLEKIG